MRGPGRKQVCLLALGKENLVCMELLDHSVLKEA
jgi:hypothetical protein